MTSFLWRNLKGYRFMVFLAMLMAVAQVVATLFSAFPMKFILDKLTGAKTDPPPFLNPLISIFDNIGRSGSANQAINVHSATGVILFSVALIMVLGIATAILQYFELLLAARVAVNLTARLRKKLFSHLERLSLDWHGRQKKGDLVQRVTSNIADIEKFVTDGVVDSVTGVLTIVGVVVVMLLVNWQFTVLSTVILPAMIVSILGYTSTIKAANKKASKASGQVASVATEDIGAITVLKAFTLEEREGLRFQKYVGKNREASLRAGGLQAQFTPIVGILAAIGTAIITGVGAYVASGQSFNFVLTIAATTVSLGTLSVFLSYLGMFYQPLRNLSKLANLMTAASTGADRIQEVLDAAPEVVESNQPYYGPQQFKGDIVYDNVVFSYSPNRPVLKGINLHIPAGKKVALVGLSGGGKTTLVKLISRFYEIQQGAVRIDGIDNRSIPLGVLRQNVSMVLQDNVLFEGTIRENIAIGKPGATMEEIIQAAKQAYVHETIMSYEAGYETEVREQGKNFSGGQRQRLAIARAVLRASPILILDEPTAALDVEAEAEVMNALDKLVVGRTVLMISHRLSTLGSVDDIIVLKDGQIVEQGSFKDLKRRGGVFANLLDEQNRYNQDRDAGKSILRSAFAPKDFAPPALPPQPPRTPNLQPSGPNIVVPPMAYPGNGGRPGPSVQPVRGPQPQQQGSNKARVLIEIDGRVVGERRLDKPELTVGRLSANDIQVPSQRVSRLHAKIRWENGTWVIEDAESLNGLIYQGNLVERHIFTNGDRVHVAPTAVIQFSTM
ncbi:MAG TPA: ABC transporter transmembrane domain-containing protein [Ktedonobacteraceae bacterium]|nr:ABC transporter transmembrane domain-containing protein [Ktedonobacteraceae bacterium]